MRKRCVDHSIEEIVQRLNNNTFERANGDFDRGKLNHWYLAYRVKIGLRNDQCDECKRKTWMKHRIPLETHHKDGNNKDNCPENLQRLCRNCHGLKQDHCTKET